LWKFIQTSQTETCSDCKSQGTMIVQGHWRKLLSYLLLQSEKSMDIYRKIF
jgi:hypothetical protein